MKIKNYMTQLKKLELQMDDVCYAMEDYVLENYRKVPLDAWNDNCFFVVPHLDTDWLIFGEPRKTNFRNRFRKYLPLKRRIESISFTRDELDGEFSVNFNDGCWSFLRGKEIMPYYGAVYEYLNQD